MAKRENKRQANARLDELIREFQELELMSNPSELRLIEEQFAKFEDEEIKRYVHKMRLQKGCSVAVMIGALRVWWVAHPDQEESN
jgi:hypothetical protein